MIHINNHMQTKRNTNGFASYYRYIHIFFPKTIDIFTSIIGFQYFTYGYPTMHPFIFLFAVVCPVFRDNLICAFIYYYFFK